MEPNNTADLQQTLTQNLKQLSDLSFSLAQPLVGTLADRFSSLSQSVLSSTPAAISIPKFKLQSDDCCVPKNECPPHCLHQIHRTAMVGERVIIPFVVKNGCSSSRTYRIGVRELKDLDGQMAPGQPVLNKSSVSLAGGQQERVLLMIDLAHFTEKTYQVEVVLREKDYNQNICITLQVGNSAAPVVTPVDEKKYRLRWQSWKDHFYCDTGARRPRTETTSPLQPIRLFYHFSTIIPSIMQDSNNSLKKELEALLSKTIEANKVFVTESSGLLKQMGAAKGDATKINIFQNDFLSKALSAYASLNIQHAQNMLDLGMSLVRSVNATGSSVDAEEGPTPAPGREPIWEPAFILSGTIKAGDGLQLSFIVDNYKKEEVPCELVHHPYIRDRDPSKSRDFKTRFSPSRFTLEPGGAQPVDVQVRSTKNTPPGIYESQVQIKGFEPAYFLIQLTIT